MPFHKKISMLQNLPKTSERTISFYIKLVELLKANSSVKEELSVFTGLSDYLGLFQHLDIFHVHYYDWKSKVKLFYINTFIMHNLGFTTWNNYITVIDLFSCFLSIKRLETSECVHVLMSPASSASRWRLKHSRWQQDDEEPPHQGGLIIRTWGQELLRWS